jgi:hypothetical protein
MQFAPLMIGLFLVFFIGRRAARRRVRAGQGAWVWLYFAPMILGGLVILWAAGPMLGEAPLLGVAMAVGGILYLASILSMLGRASRGISAATSAEEAELALTESMTDHQVRIIGVTLIGGLIAVVILIIYGVIQAAK